MKLVRFGKPGFERPGVMIDQAPGMEGPVILDVRGMAFDIVDYDPHFFKVAGVSRVSHLMREKNCKYIPAESVRLGPPILASGKIICMGGNYAEHVKESGSLMPKEPVFFSKALSSVTGPFDPVVLPRNASVVDGEVELAVVIGKTAKHVTADDAMDFVVGYMVLNDVSDRVAQKSGGQWFRAKSADTFCPMGPFLVTKNDIENIENLELHSKLNGEFLQKGNTSEMVLKIPEVIENLSRTMTLHPGDVISTGTPAGIGSVRNPPIVLKAGDVLETSVEGLGTQRADVRQ